MDGRPFPYRVALAPLVCPSACKSAQGSGKTWSFCKSPTRTSRRQIGIPGVQAGSAERMRTDHLLPLLLSLLAAPLMTFSGDVLQHHLTGSRDAAYVDPLMTRKGAAGIHRDKTFNAPIQGPVYTQPLYVTDGPGGKSTLIVATERHVAVALDAATGAPLWAKT